MSTLSGHRRTPGAAAAIAAVAFAAGLSLGTAPAYAADSQTVNFTGGSVLSMLVCKSEPSVARLNVPRESRVMFVNRLGQAATLRINGQPAVEVGPNKAAPVVFHRGPVSVSMTFSCGAGIVQQFSAASVSVTGGGAPPTQKPTAKPSTPAASHSAPAKSRAGETGRAALSPVRPATPSSDAVVPAGDGGGPAAPDPAAGAATNSGKGGNAVALEPIVTASGTPRDSASGLLALVAAVCAIGVTIASIRAIISKRTTQTRYA
ncbi:hypothetical protein [Planosporangium mesophilum]|uniref:Uncharacterized protein n=1 Tax=Planosporangium mesophilum TaxID=689768 RepID=A0A8J3TBI6_9ACTN|nr:hypothetical protein [Planosporangium mesophilum]NJC82251.1 hypothetical protein [Planosporangium mesophilum]GII22301.1 hypothetical protein Pme01_18980 [Planosporangium mesophilum]